MRHRPVWRGAIAVVVAATLMIASGHSATAAGHRIDGLQVASAISTLYEAEAGTVGGGTTIDSNNAGFTGTGFANFSTTGGSLQLGNVSGGGGGSSGLTIRFANGSGRTRTGRLVVNGTGRDITFPTTSNWTTWQTTSLTVPLNGGGNTIRFESTGQDLANIDHIVVAADDGATAPAITTQPVSQTVPVGAGVTFSVTATGAPPLSYQWRRNGAAVAGATGAGYTITNVQPGHAGDYTVVVTNSLGSVTSNPATLTVSDTPPPQSARPRVIAMTDGEIDDRSSMVRFLTYASDYDVAGIVQTNSRYQKSGHSGEKWIERQLDLYQQVLPNLRTHKAGYPDASALRAVLRVGNENSGDLTVAPPNMSVKDTPGSQLIIDRLLDSDPRPVHVAVWGGANTAAYALWKLKTQYTAAQYAYAVSRLWIYCIWYQDGGGQWIEDNIPGAKIYEAYKWDNVWDYQSLSGPSPDHVKAYMTQSWLDTNVKRGHGPLGAAVPQTYVSEGDTPSFLPQIDNGLTQYADYTLGGWGGRPVFDKGNHMTDGVDDGNANKPFWRWIPAAQNDYAARMDWQVATRFSDANHPPVARVAGGLARTVSPGQTVTLDASPSTDPDGNALNYKWWQYADADSVSAKVSVSNDTARTGAGFVVPNEPGRKIHIILEVTDNGSPSLTHYQRVVFTIA
ncbi:nucleoside hydrolase-like domain-containing protein [Micromonospora citrea]|uniref:nucleoside hydrolase-like domain-containing protein n=1 Tax=Micromonospora citrea TaxID=47855 RepID=UPI003C4D538D